MWEPREEVREMPECTQGERKPAKKRDTEVTGMAADRMGADLTDKQCGGNDKLIIDESKEHQLQRHKTDD